VPQLQAVKSSLHSQFSWLPFSHYLFAAADNVVPLLVNEFKQASAVSPIAFSKTKEGFNPVLMMGLKEKDNLLVTAQGEWLGSYVPAYYRSHPFCMAINQRGEALLCFHQDSECVLDYLPPEGMGKHFLVEKELSPELSEIKDFLQTVENTRMASNAFCSSCEDLGLFIPWKIEPKPDAEPLAINGLYCIDENKLKSLPVGQTKSLVDSGAMGAMYYHLSSLHLINHLVLLKAKHEDAAAKEITASVSPDLFTSARDNDLVDLDW
jgi:hypothetical protein